MLRFSQKCANLNATSPNPMDATSQRSKNMKFGLTGIGECMVELSDNGAGLLRQSFAGDVFNTLWYARRALGVAQPVRFLSAVGADPLSEQMISSIEAAGINTAHILRVPDRRPGLYMIHLDGAERSFSYWREHSAARLLASDPSHLASAVADTGVIYFSGITLAILPPEDAEGFLRLLAERRADGTMIAFDPNIRPALWDTTERMRTMIGRAAALSSIVLPSFDDEVNAFADAAPSVTLARYLSGGAEMVVLKNGAGDVLVQQAGEGAHRFPTPPVAAPVDTTGAGDSFNGAFLAEYMSGGDVAASVKAGQTCAAEVICHRGALIDVHTPDDETPR